MDKFHRTSSTKPRSSLAQNCMYVDLGVPAKIRGGPRVVFEDRAVSIPSIRYLATFVDDRILAPALYRAHLRRQRRTTTRGAVSE